MGLEIDHTGRVSVEVENAKQAARQLRYAIRYARNLAGVTHDKGPWPDDNNLGTAEDCIIKAARLMGIYLGGERPGEIDVREV